MVLGTAREGRQSERVAKAIFELLKEQHERSHYVDIRDHLETFQTTRIEDETDSKWRDTARQSNGFIFVIPEYNHSYPGEWKLLMDSLHKQELIGKVAGLVGVSSGHFGGVRALEQAALSLQVRGMYVIKDSLVFPRVKEQFTEDGSLRDEQHDRTKTFIEHTIATIKNFRS